MRARHYETQPSGHRAFLPAKLPPVPAIVFDAEMLSALTLAERALGRLDGSSGALPNPDLFVSMYVRKEAVLSSQIEGTQASLADLLEFEAEKKDARGENESDVVEVVNYVRALNYGLTRLSELPISMRLIREIHKELMDDVRGGDKAPGELRKIQNWIGGQGADIKEARFVPPPPHKVAEALSELEKFVHNDGQLPFLIKVGLVHAQFETIHPFLDGNGRIGRLLITLLLCEQKILRRPLLYLSYYLKANRTEYYDRLQATRDHGDWEGWLKFFLKGIAVVSEEATETARKIVDMREEHRNAVMSAAKKGAKTALDLLESLYWQPFITVENVVEITGLTYPNANRLVSQFVGMGLLVESSGQKRNRRFIYLPYLKLF